MVLCTWDERTSMFVVGGDILNRTCNQDEVTKGRRNIPLTLLFLGVVILFVDMRSLIYGVGQQLEGVHHLDVSTFLFPDQGSDHCDKPYTWN